MDGPHRSKALVTGYLHPGYAASLAEFGEPVELTRSGSYLLRRPIPGTPHQDLMGCYPLFCCRDWGRLSEDLQSLQSEFVAAVLVTDPWGSYDEVQLRATFEVVTRFKQHLVTDLSMPLECIASYHHRYYVQRALRHLTVHVTEQPTEFASEWTQLYRSLIERHRLRGIKAFSPGSFEKQLSLPGTVLFRSLHAHACVGAHIWYVQGKVAYSHLTAINASGYALGASYALMGAALKYFQKKAHWLNLGSSAGLGQDQVDGLFWFKKGFATSSRPVYLCGSKLNATLYDALARRGLGSAASYFPAYRQGELG